MTHVQQLQNSAGVSKPFDVRPGLHLLRRAADSAYRQAPHCSIRVCFAQTSGAERLDGLGPLRGEDQGAGEGAAGVVAGLDWPGKGYGVHGPQDGETPLSWAEVIHTMQTEEGIPR